MTSVYHPCGANDYICKLCVSMLSSEMIVNILVLSATSVSCSRGEGQYLFHVECDSDSDEDDLRFISLTKKIQSSRTRVIK